MVHAVVGANPDAGVFRTQQHPLVVPAPFARLHEAREMINLREGSAAFLPEYLGAYEKLAPDLRARVANA